MAFWLRHLKDIRVRVKERAIEKGGEFGCLYVKKKMEAGQVSLVNGVAKRNVVSLQKESRGVMVGVEGGSEMGRGWVM